MERKKKLSIIILILALAVIAALAFIVAGTRYDKPDDQQYEQSAVTTSGKISLRILLPETTYRDMDKFTEAYNSGDNKYFIDLVRTNTSDGIDPADYDALIIPGGKHVHPSFYGADIECNEHGFDEALDQLEIDLVNIFTDVGKPVLGICRGCQLVNVALGGTLCQDIGMTHYKGSVRETATVEDTDMRKLVGKSVKTLHYHHQAVDELADGMTVTMVDPEDGTIEAIEHDSMPIYCYQFHPEKMYVKKDPVLSENGRIFMDFFFDVCEKQKE